MTREIAARMAKRIEELEAEIARLKREKSCVCGHAERFHTREFCEHNYCHCPAYTEAEPR